MLSVVIPAYNEENNIENTATYISSLLQEENIDHELLFIDDGSKDGTWEKILKQHDLNEKVKGISFSKNFGKESAIFAGLTESSGDCVAVIDCDLQHPPEKLIEMYRLWEEGYEIVEGIKRNRGNESRRHSLAAKAFYSLLNSATGMDMSNASDYKLLDRKAVNVLINMPERNSFFRALSLWIGFNSIQIEYDVRERASGESKWSTSSLVQYAIDNISSFTSVPMYIVSVLGGILLTVGIVLSIITLYQKWNGSSLEGFTTVIILQCFTSSIIMISLGIIGFYIAKIYHEIKGRPRYIISKRA